MVAKVHHLSFLTPNSCRIDCPPVSIVVMVREGIALALGLWPF